MEKFAREIDLESVGKVLRIEQNLVGDVGCVVWDAALALALKPLVNTVLKLCGEKTTALKPLVNTVLKLCGEKTTVMMSFEDRSESFAEHGKLVREFFDSMKDNDFECDAVPCCQQHPEFVAEEIKLFALKRKSK
ncbi:unnamed protein product [Notodromas monacha]|uniref:Uncharacterized protein n=1 Tax=Notodromas monacha TaxID=399045 RepID=A0A7R9C090_9CRUS|nr:unnamed protein product [Notodromas monacha]CAG0925055.1 unnamed protein product [Notodromas monacha]